jgi:ankyrin repeat protein
LAGDIAQGLKHPAAGVGIERASSAAEVIEQTRADKRIEELLLAFGATPMEGHLGDWPADAHNWMRISPLHDAARKEDVRQAKKLLDAGANLNARDQHLRSTPLARAAKFGQLEMVKFLLQHGAPKSVPDDPDWATPFAWATRRGHDEIVRLLS